MLPDQTRVTRLMSCVVSQVAEMTGRKGMLARTEHGVQWVERRAEVLTHACMNCLAHALR